ncbi:MAG TPA: hypothetical protein VD902_00090 [Symbiobacteriaceae bacterium]|nr:hypothetical protein [Symbiobacteriaceae bacterium]
MEEKDWGSVLLAVFVAVLGVLLVGGVGLVWMMNEAVEKAEREGLKGGHEDW